MSSVYLWETKTTSEDLEPGSTFWKRTILDPQLSLYLPALRDIGYDPRGCLYDVLRKPGQEPSSVALVDDDGIKIVRDAAGQRVRTKDGKKWRQTGDTEAGYRLDTRPETPEEYGSRCLAAISENPSRYYARGIVVRLEEDEREAAADTWNTAGQLRNARRLRIFPRNPDSCVSWGRECEYLSVCANMADINDPILFKKEEKTHSELDEDSGDLSLLTQSSMRCYRSCPRKFYYRYELRQRPLRQPETLTTGKSVHESLDVFRRTGDIEAAKRALTTEDPFVRAKETAMVIGYMVRWGTPRGFVKIEHQFRISLINPETGAASKTFDLGGRVDGVVEVETAKELMG